MLTMYSNLCPLSYKEQEPMLNTIGKTIDKFLLTEFTYTIHGKKSLEITMITYDKNTIETCLDAFNLVSKNQT